MCPSSTTRELVGTSAIILLLTVLLLPTPSRAEINCFKCSSRNGSNMACQDPFAPALTTYVKACKVPKRNHVGEFPANFCVKLTGISTTSGDVLVIRDCVLKNMESQCGAFKFQKETLHGCVLTCNYDGCNTAVALPRCNMMQLLVTSLLLLMMTRV